MFFAALFFSACRGVAEVTAIVDAERASAVTAPKQRQLARYRHTIHDAAQRRKGASDRVSRSGFAMPVMFDFDVLRVNRQHRDESGNAARHDRHAVIHVVLYVEEQAVDG